MIDTNLEKVQILIQQQNFEKAKEMLSSILSQEPTNIDALIFYAHVLMQIGETEKATQVINNLIETAPDLPTAFYLKCQVEAQKLEFDQAEASISEAINLNPEEADYFAYWASIKLVRKKYEEALKLADHALSLDAEHILALNVRSNALTKLNRNVESFDTIKEALNEDPNNSYTHSNYGWNLLEAGKPKKALEHFREALRLDPSNEHAKSGTIEAMKAKYFLYRMFLKYIFAMGKLSANLQWVVIIGFFILQKVIANVSVSNPEMAPYLNPILYIMIFFAISTWILTPISNLVLRLNPYGRYLLDKEEIMSSNLVGGSLIVFLIGLIGNFITPFPISETFFAIAFFGFSMMLPMSSFLSEDKKGIVFYATIALAALGIFTIYLINEVGTINIKMSTYYIYAFIGYQFLANARVIRKNNY
ncbi:tetratricopeptide repeat protein [Aureivirga sp. CE67]|uniref:tetratricopeptide repeat protein n=1 Tax=Aureivirga sp. CE67 TaxID=1788983 RepID=UPI0018C970E3|nr:tetratricopeptide repeat protein [Aureivirga sp. CE67]